MNTNVLYAVFKRNFLSYFATPTGYLFICVFVELCGIAAFWPNDFFNANLANLNQLNKFFPLIMLVFIPAITMSVWADERRQGTDELLLTIPAGDFDIVLGKYLAAVAIYSVSLLFSLICNYTVLQMLGEPDVGLFLGTYFGYWMVGLAMLAVGMVASFLTGNLTVAYILGALLCAPLVFAMPEVMTVGLRALIAIPEAIVGGVSRMLLWINADWTALNGLHQQLADAAINVPSRWSIAIANWGIPGQLADFGRGVVSLSGILYFTMITVVMLYLSMVLIGRRHWRSGRLGGSAFVVYPLLHVVCLIAFAILWLLLLGTSMQALTLALVLVGLYLLVQLGIILAWSLGRPRVALLPGHFITRTLALATIGAGVVLLFQQHDLRLDTTSERLNSLSPKTVSLLKDLKLERPVQIEAFISPASEVPESFIQTRLNLLNGLRELAAYGGDEVNLVINNTERYSEQAARAAQRYGITSREVRTSERGTLITKNVYMGVAFSCGLNKVIVPFIDRGIPVEYELVRSIATVTEQKRKTVGILQTDAKLNGDMMSGAPTWPIVAELEKQYEVKQVDPTQPIKEKYDVLLAVQPSSLGPEEMNHFIEAVRSGQPTAIFEDPCPLFVGWVPATTAPKSQPNQMAMMMGQRPQPKGDIGQLWSLLGVDFLGDRTPGDEIVWQDYNPFPKFEMFKQRKEFVFVNTTAGGADAFNEENPISSGLQLVLFPFPGAVSGLKSSNLEFTDLLQTGTRTGTVRYGDLIHSSPFSAPQLNPDPRLYRTKKAYVMAARIRGELKDDQLMAPEEEEAPSATDGGDFQTAEAAAKAVKKQIEEAKKGKEARPGPAEAKEAKKAEVNVVLVADVDMLAYQFFFLREQGDSGDDAVHFDFDNVNLVLNILDDLAGDERFIDIRKHRPKHRTLTRVEEATKEANAKTVEAREKAYEKAEKIEKDAQNAMNKKVAEISSRKNVKAEQAFIELALTKQNEQRKLDAAIDEAKQARDRDVTRIETTQAQEERRVQDSYKMWAFLLPPILPLAVGLVVLLVRRAGEREGVSRSRLKS